MPFFLKGGHRNRKLFQIAKKYFEIGFLAGMFSVYMYNANKKPGTFYLKNFLFSRLLLYKFAFTICSVCAQLSLFTFPGQKHSAINLHCHLKSNLINALRFQAN